MRTMGVTGDSLLARHAPIIIAFAILAAYTYQSGLRAPALIAFVKDTLIYLVILVAVVYLPAKLGGWGGIFDAAEKKFAGTAPGDGILLNANNQLQYITLALGSALDHIAVPAGQHAGDAVRVEEQRERRAQRQGEVLQLVVGVQQDPVAGRGRRRELLLRRVEDAAPAAQLVRQVDHRHDDHEVDQGVLDERDQRGRPQPGLVGVRRQDRERDDDRRMPGEQRCRRSRPSS